MNLQNTAKKYVDINDKIFIRNANNIVKLKKRWLT